MLCKLGLDCRKCATLHVNFIMRALMSLKVNNTFPALHFSRDFKPAPVSNSLTMSLEEHVIRLSPGDMSRILRSCQPGWFSLTCSFSSSSRDCFPAAGSFTHGHRKSKNLNRVGVPRRRTKDLREGRRQQ